ncbi:unnamed protein product [Hymenolepis diminuta]|uniref:Anoctamin n=1 Tax=Hymenolepis diminuta TaxID=6216 RepID=A0A564YUB7_HYMDI|nr:unnamed protein product [Hymenolepis diminuta]
MLCGVNYNNLEWESYRKYFGYREPPNSTKPYALTSVFWYIVAAKVIFISVFIVSVYNKNKPDFELLTSSSSPRKSRFNVTSKFLRKYNFLSGVS